MAMDLGIRRGMSARMMELDAAIPDDWHEVLTGRRDMPLHVDWCELFVSADGMTEKLASGFLKPFLNHLRAVEEQVIAGRESVTLERPQAYHGRSWFTKGTLERFVRFVSTPEVLERVKFIEDEFAQLEQVRSIQASSFLQVEESYSIAGPVYQRNGGLGFSVPLGTFAIPKLAQNYPYDAVESHREASRVELLRAMDVRLLALRQEQSLAFSRAAAAGFSSDNMTDLIAFSEYFGADRLRMACFNFLVVLQQKVMEPNPQAVSNSCGTSFNVSEVSMLAKQEVLAESNFELTGHQRKEESRHIVNNNVSITDKTSNFHGTQSSEAVCLKLLGPPEKICQDLSADQNRTDSTNMKVSAEAWQAHPAVDPFQGQDQLLQGTTILKLSPSLDCEVSEALSANDPISSSNLLSLGGSTFESERPIKCQELSLNQAPALVLPSNQICSKFQPLDGSAKKENNLDLSTAPSPVSAPARRLSVQDAISLFENKQRRESVEVPRKLQIGKSGRASLDGLNVLSSACIGPRRWSIANSNAVGKCLQEKFQSSKLEAHAISSVPVRSGVDILLTKQEADGVGSQSKTLLQKGPNTAVFQPSQDETPMSKRDVEKQVSENKAFLDYDSVQFKLERKIAQGTPSGIPVKQGSLKTESNLTTKPASFSNVESDGSSLTQNPECFEIGDKISERVGARTTSWEEPMALQDSSIVHPLCKGSDADLEVILSCNGEQAAVVSEQNSEHSSAMVVVVSEVATIQSKAKKSSESIKADSLQSDMQNLVQMHANEPQDDADNIGKKKGRFYEQYRLLRDAKLKDENEFRKAERDAKLRLMEETLLLRKAELDAQSMELSTRDHQQARAIKLQARKADLQTLQRTKDDADVSYKEMSSNSKGRARSPPFTSCSGKEEVLTTKSQSGRRPSATSRKGATPPRSSMRGSSLSPKLAPRVTGSAMKPQKSASGVSENPLTKSVISFAIIKKENTKPLSGCLSGNNGLQTKDGAFGHFCEPNEAQPCDSTENILARTSMCGPAKEDTGLPIVGRSHWDLKMISRSLDEDGFASPSFQREVESEPGALSVLHFDNFCQEIQPIDKEGEAFARKPGLYSMKPSLFYTVEPLGSHEKRAQNTVFLESGSSDGTCSSVEDIDSEDVLREQSMGIDTSESDRPIDSGLSNVSGMQATPTVSALNKETAELSAKNAYQTTSFLVDIEFDRNIESHFHSQSGQTHQSTYTVDASTSFRAISLPHEHHWPLFSHGADSQMEQVQCGTESDHFSSSLATGFESPLLSPAYWNASQMQYALGPQKLVTAVSNKEPAKGFKKLLKFGRKKRAPDAATSDRASSYTASEGDDETEDQKYFIDMHNAKGRLDESKAMNLRVEQYTADKKLAGQSLRSLIPAPPANFKLRNDHLMGGTMLKAPKSFFSLSSFRSRGTEGRA
ncbi:hypothetical protein L7F22_055401 [Adiantum nelumboides]|nr:hypothetical protein [Adiantum nelumboides]